LHRDCFLCLTGQLFGRLLRRVTPTNFIAVPLAQIFQYVMIMHSRRILLVSS
jgi:hypothetical protein